MEFFVVVLGLIVWLVVRHVNAKLAAARRDHPELWRQATAQSSGQYGAPAGQAQPNQPAQMSAQLRGILNQLSTNPAPGRQGPAAPHPGSVPQYQGHAPGFPAVQGPGHPFQHGGQQYPAPQYQPQHQPQYQPPPQPPPQYQPQGQGQGQYQPQGPYQPRSGHQPQHQPQYQPQAQYRPPQQHGRGITGHRPPQHNLPAAQQDIDTLVRQLVAEHNEVGAIRLLCDERDMGIIEAQEYTRALTGSGRPAHDRDSGRDSDGDSDSGREEADMPNRPATADGRVEEDDRYVGSAAFATSVFDTGEDENQWASGWVDKQEADDRTDLDELWQTVRAAGTPRPS